MKKILVIEDDRDIRESLKDLLESEGYEVACAENGQLGLEVLQAGKAGDHMPDLILLDLMMPVKDGFEFRREQRSDINYGSIPVVVMSADGHVEVKRSQTDAFAYLKKPVNIDDLVRVLKDVCG